MNSYTRNSGWSAIKTNLRAAVLAGGLLTALAMGLASVPAAAASGPTFAVVDTQVVFNQSNAKANADKQLQAIAQSLQVAFQAQQQAFMLSKTDLMTLGQLLIKPNPSQADKDKIKALEDQASKDASVLNDLQSKNAADLTSDQKLQLSTLTAQATAGQQTVQDISTEYHSQIDQQSQQLNAQISAQIRTVIGTVAKAKDISVVFDSSVAMYAPTDITNDVVAAMNK